MEKFFNWQSHCCAAFLHTKFHQMTKHFTAQIAFHPTLHHNGFVAGAALS